MEFVKSTIYCEIFTGNIFVKSIFANDPHVQYKRCGMAILLRNLISRLSKFREIRENLATQKFPGIRYPLEM